MLGAPVFRTALYGPWSGNALWTAARAVPSIDLRFAESKSLTDAVSGQSLVTFTRASSGTYVGSDGALKTATNDVPRFDHNPTTGESLGLLVEEQRTNLALRSEQFDDAAWNSTAGARTVTANQITAPDGTTTADLVTADGTNAIHFVSQSFTLSAIPYSLSVFAKAGTESTVILRTFSALGNVNATFNLNTGTVVSNSAGTTAQIVAYPNGWYRCILNFTPVAATGGIGIYLSSLTAVTISTTLYLWGAQLEAGAFPTSYIPTTTATATRSADVASITGTNFSSWYRQDEGTVFADAAGVNNIGGATRRYCEIRDNATTDRLILGYSATNNNRFLVIDDGVTIADIIATGAPIAKAIGSYRVNSFQLASNGALGTEDSAGTVPTPNQMFIGSQEGGTASTFLNGTIRRLTYWPARLANTTLQAITQ